MTEIWYTAIEKLNSKSGPKWDDLMKWVNLPQLRELITLDGILKPDELWDLDKEEDWEHNIHKDFLISYFVDLDYMKKRFVNKRDEISILATTLEPDQDVKNWILDDKNLIFMGYDIKGEDGSVLLNCGGIGKEYFAEKINAVCLLDEFDFAKEVQNHLNKTDFHERHHELWAIWKLEE